MFIVHRFHKEDDMHARAEATKAAVFPGFVQRRSASNDNHGLEYEWPQLRHQLLNQWWRLSGPELDAIGPDRRKIAMLVQCKYGISSRLVENYLANLVRTLRFA